MITNRSKYYQRWSELDNDFSDWRNRYREISDFLLPFNGQYIVTERDQVDRNFNNIIDDCGTLALETLAAGLMAGMTSPARPWFRLTTSDTELTKSGPVKLWLAEVTRLMQLVFAKSNTYRALHSMYEELGAYGTAASFVMDDFKNVIHHYPLTAGEYRIATNYKGEVDALYRNFQLTVAQMVKEYGKKNCSRTVQRLYDNGSLGTRVPVIHLIEPREDRDVTKRDARNMPWMSLTFEEGSDDPNQYLRESGMREFRVLAPRWKTRTGIPYGTSPAMTAIGDVKQLQHQQLRKTQGIDYMVKPPLQIPTAYRNHELDTLPGGLLYVDTASPTGGIRSAFEVRLDLSHLLLDIKDVRERVNAAFYKDLFLMLASSDRREMTATEVAERHEEKLLMLGPVLERQHNELLDPKIEITFSRMVEAGVIPPPPPELHGRELQVEFVSMLAQAQRAVGTNSIDRFVVSLGTIAAIKPDVLDKFDSDQWADAYSDMLGVDPNLIVSDDKVALIRKNRAAQQQAAQQLAMAQGAADTASKMANANTGDKNLLTDATAAFSGYT